MFPRKVVSEFTAIRILLMGFVASIVIFLILLAPSFFKSNYLIMMYIGLCIGLAYSLTNKKDDFLVFLFIVSLSFTAININIKKYAPQMGELVPWISLPDILLGIMITIRLIKVGIKTAIISFPKAGNRAFLLLVGSCIFSYIFIAPGYSEYQSEGFFNLFSIIRGYLIFIYFYNYLEDFKKIRIIIISFASVVLIQFSFILYQWITGNFLTIVNFVYETIENTPIEQYGLARRAFGTYNYPSIAASVIAIIYPISIAITSLRALDSKFFNLCKYTIIILGPLCVLLSGGRYSLIALFILTPLILFLFAKRYKQRDFSKVISLILIVFIVIGILSITISPLADYWNDRFSHQNFMINSLEFRLLIYKIGIRALSSGYLFGVGWGNGDRFSIGLLNNKQEVALYRFGLHNGYVALLIENGILGLIIYLIWYFSFLRASFRKNDDYDLSIQFASLAGIFSIIIIQMILVDTQGAFLKNEAEFMHFCLCLSLLRVFDNEVNIHVEKLT